jgi:GLPGLI family protein
MATAQENLRVEYQVRFNDQFDRGRADRMHHGFLFINNNQSRYYTIHNTAYVPKDEHDISFMPDTANQVYTSQDKGLLIAEEINMKGKHYFVSDSLYPMRWEISAEEKKIDSLTCIKAECVFRGRRYIAWFTPDIPLPYGPWKIGGLPGLVVDLHDKDENLMIRLTGIRKSSEIPTPPANVQFTMEDHVADIKNFLKRIKANNRASSSGDCITCQQQSVVEFYTWEKFPE